MNNNKELVVPYDMQAMKAGIGMLIILIAFIFLMFWASSYFYILIGAYFTRVLKIALGIIIAMFVYTLLYTVWFVWVNDRPAAILSPEGIWVNRFNFIPWDNIQACPTFIYPGTPIEVVSIMVKDQKKLFKYASIGGKITLLWAKLFNYPHIILNSIAVENEEILTYAQAYVKETE